MKDNQNNQTRANNIPFGGGPGYQGPGHQGPGGLDGGSKYTSVYVPQPQLNSGLLQQPYSPQQQLQQPYLVTGATPPSFQPQQLNQNNNYPPTPLTYSSGQDHSDLSSSQGRFSYAYSSGPGSEFAPSPTLQQLQQQQQQQPLLQQQQPLLQQQQPLIQQQQQQPLLQQPLQQQQPQQSHTTLTTDN